MNRRGFIKVLLGCSAAATLPVIGKAVSDKPVTVVKKTHNVGITGESEMRFARHESVRFIESPIRRAAREIEQRSEKARITYGGFYENKKLFNPYSVQEEMNKIASARVDLVKTANVGPTVIDKPSYDRIIVAGRQMGRTETNVKAFERLVSDLSAAKA